MTAAIVQSRDGITLLGGGTLYERDLDEALGIAPCLVAADGGAEAARRAGVTPQAVIGDLDSLSPETRAILPPGIVHQVDEQDDTDFGKCLRLTRAPFHVAIGFTGARMDHALAVLSDVARHPGPVLVLGEREVIFRLPPRLELDLAPGTRVSLFPMGPVSGSSTGLRWPIDRLGFAPAGRIGTSNEALGRVHLRVVGPMLALVPRDCLALALNALRVAG
ncbi:thiamine diphosphokinase [Frigidibacter sp. MR17.14]|uniref:thiamine diphosphokinase n=1 Tax=Frigidibacter sp. MR17.14 TaxID=3126509 RepID=UPI0030130A8D